tara:strand:+ start:293 stop:844 length:552 start_codon:yes stop_codon:yes gene_type:complete
VKKIFPLILIIFFYQSDLIASNGEKIINKLNKIENLSFNFIQTINGKDEKGECIIEFPKKIFCEYEKRKNKILVSNGKSLVIKKGKQYFRYPIKTSPFEFILDKSYLINKIKSTSLNEVENKYLFFQISENNNDINIFFSKDNYDLVGWQIEDVYQNLAVTYIFDLKSNKKINKKIFNLPKND